MFDRFVILCDVTLQSCASGVPIWVVRHAAKQRLLIGGCARAIEMHEIDHPTQPLRMLPVVLALSALPQPRHALPLCIQLPHLMPVVNPFTTV